MPSVCKAATSSLTCIVPRLAAKEAPVGRPPPGYRVRLVDAEGREQPEAEIWLALNPAPLGLTQGYQSHDGEVKALSGSLYRTGDVAAIDPDSNFTYIGRDDDVFTASDYRISPRSNWEAC